MQLCEGCPKHRNCVEMCHPIAKLVNYEPQLKEMLKPAGFEDLEAVLLGEKRLPIVDYKDLIIEARRRAENTATWMLEEIRAIEHKRTRAIIGLLWLDLSVYDISKIINLTPQRIWQIIADMKLIANPV